MNKFHDNIGMYEPKAFHDMERQREDKQFRDYLKSLESNNRVCNNALNTKNQQNVKDIKNKTK